MEANTIQFSFKYNRKKRLNSNGEALLQLLAYQGKTRKRKYLSTDIYLKPNQWLESKSLIINHPLEAQLNWKLTDLKRSYEKKVIDLIKKYDKCSLEDLSRDYTSSYLSFIEFYDAEVKIAEKNRAYGTIQTYKSALVKLKEYRSSIYFSDLDYRFIQGFDGYLQGLSLRQTVVAKYHKIIKRMISQARKKNLIESNPYERFTIKSGETAPRTFLTMNEIQKIQELEFQPEEMYLEIIRDGFLFSCFTSLRDESNSTLTAKKFHKDGGSYFMTWTSKKTGKTNTLPLAKLFPKPGSKLSYPELILEKAIQRNKELYGHKYANKPLFGDMTSQHRNRSLKTIATKAKIKKNLTTHVGRHTFGTHMANKIPPHLLQTIMQHSDYKTTLAYVHLSDKLISDGLENIEW